jgi:hypothetical protein
MERAGKGNLQLKLTIKNYKYKNRLESSKQVVGPISEKTLVEWRLGGCGNKFIGMCTEANSVKGAESGSFLLLLLVLVFVGPFG